MKSMFRELREAVVSTLVLTIVCCGLYPIAVFGAGRLLFPDKADGSLIRDGAGNVRGSALLAQGFTGERYFHPRPSAAGSGYDAANSGGSNLGPTSGKLAGLIGERIAAYRRENSLGPSDSVPADAVTASGSGLDPHISPRNAEIQSVRVAKARGVSPETIRSLIRTNTTGPGLGFLGAPGVNVLQLNLALDALK